MISIGANNLQEINKQISVIWDKNVSTRIKDIMSNSDRSYNSIIKPWVIERVLINSTEESRILDIGCGCGFLTNCIYDENRKNVFGIDISKTSIKYATELYPHINFTNGDIYNFNSNLTYDLCLAVMVLNNVPNVDLFLSKVNQILSNNGKIIIIIPHPCFWPNTHIQQTFDYMKEFGYEIKFSTKGHKDYPSNIYYFHRPLEKYLNSFEHNGFKVLQFDEILEISEIKTPDILGIVLQKTTS